MKVGIVSPTATYWPLYLMERDGLVELVELGSTAAGVRALLDREVDVAATCPDELISSGKPLRVAAGLIDRPPTFVVATAEIGGVEALRGRRVATTSVQGSVSLFLRAFLRRSGLERGDYVEVPVGPTPRQVAALEAGDVDAAMVTAPFEQILAARGFAVLARVGAALGPCAFTTINVREGWTDTAEWHGFEDGLVAAIRRLGDRAGRQRELTALAQGIGVEPGGAPEIDYDVRLDPASIERLIGFMRAEGRAAGEAAAYIARSPVGPGCMVEKRQGVVEC